MEYFERQDETTPEGGRKVTMYELKDLTKEERLALGKLELRGRCHQLSATRRSTQPTIAYEPKPGDQASWSASAPGLDGHFA